MSKKNMQNILIVGAHPEPKSFNVALRHQAEQFFRDGGKSVVVSDLYAMDFNPVASADDFAQRRNPDYLIYPLEQRHALKEKTLAPDIEKEVQKLLKANLVLFVFPLFWFSVPAILKGWIDRVLLSGLTFGGRRFYNRGGLLGKKAMLIITLGGRDHMFGKNSIHGEMESLLRPIQRGTLQYVGFDVLPPFMAWHVPYVTDEVRQGYLVDLAAHLEKIEDYEPLPRPSLDDFDEIMRPKKIT